MNILTVGFKASIRIYTYTDNLTCLGTRVSILSSLNFCIRYFVNLCIYTDVFVPHMPVEVRGQMEAALFPPGGSRESNTGCQACHQAPLPAEPSHRP